MESISELMVGARWEWNDFRKVLQYSNYIDQSINKTIQQKNIASCTSAKSTSDSPNNSLQLKFKETLDSLEQVRFKRYFQRKVGLNDVEVITLQDVKDIALFTSSLKNITVEFINFFHILTMDRFLRSLIIYFHYYTQVWDNLIQRREETARKLHQPLVTVLENVVRDDLADLRCMVSREYCSLLMGVNDSKCFHHLSNKNKISLGERDRRFMEILIQMAVRVVWLALLKRNHNLIEMELNRMFRTDDYNVIAHKTRKGTFIELTPNEYRVLNGDKKKEERKILQHSSAIKELSEDHDYRMLAIGQAQFNITDKRLDYLTAAYSAPEEQLQELGVTIGILGFPRSDFDVMLNARVIKIDDNTPPQQFKLPLLSIPSRVPLRSQDVPNTFPKRKPKFEYSRQMLKTLKYQRLMWTSMVNKVLKCERLSFIVSDHPTKVQKMT